jgi:N-acetylmuramoyl-L-alanine amidase
MDGEEIPMRNGRFARRAIPGLVALALLLHTGPARADAPAPLSVTSMRSWSSPASTRIVFDFTGPVDAVMPDSGSAARVVISVPAAGVVPATGLPTVLAVRDSAVDSVFAAFDERGVRFTVTLAPGATFHAFTLAAVDDKPFRIVVDVTGAGAKSAEEKRLADIAAAKKRDRVRLVYIDAGHGGDDTGARGLGGVLEKNVTLAVAAALADELNKIRGVRALLTRDSDYFIPLHQRYKIAEQARSDLFISIHCNSSRRRGSGSGTEVYFLSLKGASDQADKDLADIENAADLVGGVPPQAEDDVVSVLYNVKRNSALERSQLLAETLLDHIAADRRVESRGIKQAGFAVLKSVEFPSVLVETAFINNPREVKLLRDPEFQRQLGKQLATGVVAYFGAAGVKLGGAADSTRAGGPAGAVVR